MHTSRAAGAVAVVMAALTLVGCSDEEPEPAPVPSVDSAPLEVGDAALAEYAAEDFDDSWLCGTLPHEIADPLLAGVGEIDAPGAFPLSCRVSSFRDDGERSTVLDITTSGSTELVPDQARGVLDQRVAVDLPGGVQGWVVEVPAFRGSAPGVFARAVGRTGEGEPLAVGVHLAPGTRGRDLAADAEVLLRYYVMRADLTAPLVAAPAADL